MSGDNPQTNEVLRDVVRDAYDRLIAPAIEREIRSNLTERAEDGAIRVFGKNLEQLADAAADCRTGGARMGPGVSDRL